MKQHLLKYVTRYIDTRQRMNIPTMCHSTINMRHPLYYRHIACYDTGSIFWELQHMSEAGIIHLCQNPKQNLNVHMLSRILHHAILHNYLKLVRCLLSNTNLNPSAKINNADAITLASRCGFVKIVRLLLNDPRVDPSTDDNWAIHYASREGHTEIVRLLLNDPRVDPSANNNNAIFGPCTKHENVEVVRLLLQDPRVDPSAEDNRAIQ